MFRVVAAIGHYYTGSGEATGHRLGSVTEALGFVGSTPTTSRPARGLRSGDRGVARLVARSEGARVNP